MLIGNFVSPPSECFANEYITCETNFVNVRCLIIDSIEILRNTETPIDYFRTIKCRWFYAFCQGVAKLGRTPWLSRIIILWKLLLTSIHVGVSLRWCVGVLHSRCTLSRSLVGVSHIVVMFSSCLSVLLLSVQPLSGLFSRFTSLFFMQNSLCK